MSASNDKAAALHALNRAAFGPRPGDADAVAEAGARAYLERQLEPDSIPIPPELTAQIRGIRTLGMTPPQLFAEFQEPIREAAKGDVAAKKAARRAARQVVQEAIYARIVRAIHGPRQLQEVLTAFWFNHFNVFAGKGLCSIWIGAFEEEAIRPHTMGRFRDLLGATAKHPAMLFYLDNWQNTGPGSPGARGKFDGINENCAREVMELHTLGVNGGYHQDDVIALAHILTGWSIERPGFARRMGGFGGMGGGGLFGRFARRRADAAGGAADAYGFRFYPRRHDYSDKLFLGRKIAGGGMAEGERALDMLAESPATAKHLSFQLAQYFVADAPPDALVERMARRYLQSGGEIRAVLETMFLSAEFSDPRCRGTKFKSPYEYVISCARAAGVEVINTRPLAGSMAMMGMPLYGCQTPNGYSNTREAWLNPDGMMMRLSFATAIGAGRLPLNRPPQDYAAGSPDGAAERPMMRPAEFIDRPPPPDPAALAMTLGDLFTPNTAAAVEQAPPPLRAPLILGSPEFMTR